MGTTEGDRMYERGIGLDFQYSKAHVSKKTAKDDNDDNGPEEEEDNQDNTDAGEDQTVGRKQKWRAS